MGCSMKTLCDIFELSLDTEKEIEKVIQGVFYIPDEHRRSVIERKLKEKKQTNSELCSKCGGECCKNEACHYSPKDFKEEDLSFENLKKFIDKGYISILRTPSEEVGYEFVAEFVYVLRIRAKDRPISDISVDGKVGCCLLTEKGCRLSYENRPLGGKMMLPYPERECYSLYSFELCVADWFPYRKILKELFNFYEGKEIEINL